MTGRDLKALVEDMKNRGLLEYDFKLFKKKRKALGITALELAEQCKLTRQTIYTIETGRSNNQSTILLIGLVLDILADEAGMMDVFYEIEKGE